MQARALLVATFLTAFTLTGCSESGGTGPVVEPRNIEYDLFVATDSQGTVDLYRLNDGVNYQAVVAMGFQLAGQEELLVPNPELRIREGDSLTIRLTNLNELAHTFHLHGNLGSWLNDGVPFVNDLPVHQGQTVEYHFEPEDLPAGTYFYHCHVDVAHHMDLGMVGALIVEEIEPEHDFDREYTLMLDEWDNCHIHGAQTGPVTDNEQSGEFSERAECVTRFLQDRLAQGTDFNAVRQDNTSPVRDPLCDTYDGMADGPAKDALEPFVRQLNCEGGHFTPPPQQTPRSWYPTSFPVYNPEYNSYTLNGKAFPDTAPIWFGEGERVKLRFINIGEEIHSMHIHGHTMEVINRDIYPLPAPFKVDTLGIMPGERYDVIVEANNPGLFPLHDHVGKHVQNDYQSPGGIFTLIAYEGDFAAEVGLDESSPYSIDLLWQVQPYLAEHAHGGAHTDHGGRETVQGTVRYDYGKPVFPST